MFLKLDEYEEARPDIITLTGDILNNFIRAEKCDKLANYIGMLTKFCEVYFVTGNHELRTESVAYWKTVFKSLGCVPLDDEYVLLSRNNAHVALMGVSGDTVYKGDNFKLPKKNGSITRILLAHRPENWDKACSLATLQVYTERTANGWLSVEACYAVHSHPE